MQEFTFQIDAVSEGVRIDLFLAETLDGYSRSHLQRLMKDGAVKINGKTAKSSSRLKEGDQVTVTMPDPQEPEVVAKPMELSILYEDDDVILVDKPKGMVVHPAAGHSEDTLVNGLLYHCRGRLSGINGVLRPGIVHRIDKDTTGVLVVCKNDAAHGSLAAQLKEHSITRKYLAVVCGVIEENEGVVDAPIGRNERDRLKMAINEKNGKRAVTHYRVLERFPGYTYIECSLET